MRPTFALVVAAALTLAGCAGGPTPTVNILQDEDPYAEVHIGPVSYTTPIGVTVPEKGWGGGWVNHTFVAHPDIVATVSFDGLPPASFKQDADRAVRSFLSRHRGGAVGSIQHSYRGTAESIKYSTLSPAPKGSKEQEAGTLILLRQDGKTVQVSTTGPKSLEFEIDAAGESLADKISFTPNGVPARRASALGERKEEFREKASKEAAAAAGK